MKRSAVPIVVTSLALLNVAQLMLAHAPTSSPQAHAAPPSVPSQGGPQGHEASSEHAEPGGAAKSAPRSGSEAVRSLVVAVAPVEAEVLLSGQITLTEGGRADVTAPLAGAITSLPVHVGQVVHAGDPLAIINSAFGMSPLQLAQKLEQDQAGLLQAQAQWQQAQSAEHQGQASLAQARTTQSQAQDSRLQAEAELRNARTDASRKQRLFEGGVSSQADVDDSRERLAKAEAVAADTLRVVSIAAEGVRIAQQNLVPLRESAEVAHRAVLVAQTALERDRGLYAQASVSGSTLTPGLSAVSVPAGGKPAAAASSASFVVRAPVGGVVVALPASLGLAVSPGTVLASVADTSRVYADANAYDTDLGSLAQGDAVQVRSDALPGAAFGGKVAYVGPVVDPTTRSVTVRALVANPKAQLRAGMLVNVRLTPQHPRQGITVPVEAVLYDGSSRYVVVETSKDHYARRPIREGVHTRDRIEIREGLKPGERVVTHGNLLVVPE